MRISDWSSDVCSSDLGKYGTATGVGSDASGDDSTATGRDSTASGYAGTATGALSNASGFNSTAAGRQSAASGAHTTATGAFSNASGFGGTATGAWRSEEHTSELQSLMRSSYAVFCLKKKKQLSQRHECDHRMTRTS